MSSILDEHRPRILIIAGPNGAGKSTLALEYLPNDVNCRVFINADLIAAGLSPFDPDKAAIQAGRLMIGEIERHLATREDFAFETTLSGLVYARRIPAWRKAGYRVKLIFLSLPNVETAITRVAARVQQGGHNIPEHVIRRRFKSGWANFQNVYNSLVDSWVLYSNEGEKPELLEQSDQ